jgi:hypothetical protein
MTIWPTRSRRAGGMLAPGALCTGIALLAAPALGQDQGKALQPDAVVAVGSAHAEPSGSTRQQALEPDSVVAPRATDPTSSERANPINPTAIADIPIWKRITLGTYKGPNAVREAFDAARMRIGDSADEILGRPAFPFSKTETELELVVVTAAELGFKEARIRVADIYQRAMQVGLELCPAEVGPQLRLQYVNQPIGEFLHIAMQPIATYHGDLVDLTVGNGGAGLLLIGGDGRPDLVLHSTVKFVFVRPSLIALPSVP